MTLYTDFDEANCQWLRNLVSAGRLPPGEIVCADIRDRPPFGGYRQVHAFAGIGGWPLATTLARWPADLPLWTASLPCQPFSTAGRQKGVADERHVWPAFLEAVAEHSPPVLAGEQVASRLGLRWFDGVRDDLEAAGYAVGAACLPAGALGTPMRRNRLWWMANAGRERLLPYADSIRSWAAVEPTRPTVPAGYDREAWGAFVEDANGTRRRLPNEPGLLPTAHDVSKGVVRLRAYGSAIVPPLGAAFLRAVMGTLADTVNGEPET